MAHIWGDGNLQVGKGMLKTFPSRCGDFFFFVNGDDS